jgi:calcineurin-like phosphoesterase family protein
MRCEGSLRDPAWLTADTWLIADTHFGHANIVKLCDRPLDHEEMIEHNWRALIGDDDEVLHLGDVDWRYGRMPHDLPGRVHVLPGNHDRLQRLARTGWDVLDCDRIYRQLLLITHRPSAADRTWSLNVHGHIHDNGWPPELRDGRRRVNVSIERTGYAPVRLGDVMRRLVGEWQT